MWRPERFAVSIPKKFSGAVPAGVTLIAMLLGIASAGCPSKDGRPGPQSPPAPRTVILISVDTLRADRLGCYGYNRPTSPHLDALARESVLFANVFAQSAFTLVSHKSIFAAKYPYTLLHEAANADLKALTDLPEPHGFLVGTFRTIRAAALARGMLEQGYKTAAFTDGVWMSQWFGFDRGFAAFDDSGGHLEQIVPRSLNWLTPNSRARVFLFLHTYDTHCPYVCREPFNSLFCHDHSGHVPLENRCNQVDLGNTPLMKMNLTERDVQAISDHYDGGVACADADLGAFFDALKALDLYNEALLIVTSDHGESLGEHRQIGHGGLYTEQLRVPLLFKFPASWKITPRVFHEPVEMVDVAPTVLAACGAALADDLDGRSLLPLIRANSWTRRFAVAQTTHEEGRDGITNPSKRALVIPGQWLLIRDARAESAELYDLRADPAGLADVHGRTPEMTEKLADVLAAYDPKPTGRELVMPDSERMSPELRRQLESLGYVGP